MFNFPEVAKDSDFKFNNNLLKSVTYQFSYSPNEKINESEEFIKKSLEDKYSNIQALMQGKISINVNEKEQKTPILQQASSRAGFELRTQNNTKVLNIKSDTCTLTIAGEAYQNFKEVLLEVETGLLPVLKQLGVDSFNRVAIRKVNLIGFSHDDSSAASQSLPLIFNASFVNNIMYLPSNQYLDAGLSNLSFINDPYQLIINYGLLRKAEGDSHRQALLDIDLFKKNEETSIDDIRSVMGDINQEIFNIFNWSLQKTLLESLDAEGN